MHRALPAQGWCRTTNRVTRFPMALGVLTNWFAYAANSIDLTSVSNSAGQCWNLGYNGVHQVTSITNALNQVTGLTWDTTDHEPLAGFAAERPDDQPCITTFRCIRPTAAGQHQFPAQKHHAPAAGPDYHNCRLHQRPAPRSDDQRHGVIQQLDGHQFLGWAQPADWAPPSLMAPRPRTAMTGSTSGPPKTGWAIGPATATTTWST